jgi:hypothetical protein
MRIPSNRGSEDRMKIAAVAVFVLIAVALIYFEYFYTGAPATPQPAAPAPISSQSNPSPPANSASASAARVVSTTSSALDPTLHMDAMLVTESLEYSGSGRNIFSMNSAPVVAIPNPITAARPIAAQAAAVVPCPPNCPPPPPPPPPPPIDLKFFGTENSPNGVRQAFLLHDESVFLASAGDVVLRRYRVISIEEKSIRVEDMQYQNTQTLPLVAN